MKKAQVTHLSHDPQQPPLALQATTKLPLESDPVLKKKFESALKLAGSTVHASRLAPEKNFFDANELLGEQPFSKEVKKKSIAPQEDKTRHKLSIACEEITDNSCQPYNNTPYTIIANKTATKTVNNDKFAPSTSKHKQQIPHSIHSHVDKSPSDSQAKTPGCIDDLSTSQAVKQSIKSAALVKPIIISSNDQQTVIPYSANYRQQFANKKIPSASKPDKLVNPIDVFSQPKEKPCAADKMIDKEKRTENSVEPPSFLATLSAATTEKMLATIDNQKTSTSLLNTLFNKLNAVLNVEINKNYQPPIVQLNLPQIGSLQIKIQQEQQNITIEFVAQKMGQKILLEHRQDLIDKLQRIHPDQHIQLVILNDKQLKERSKDHPQQSEDLEEEMV